VQGDTIHHQAIKSATIRGYVKAVCDLHKDRELPSPYTADRDYISVVLNAVKKYESVEDRRDMIHDEMIHYMESLRGSYHEDSLEAALIDWIYLGRFTGYRSCEWCQTTQQGFEKIDHPLWKGPEAYAFIEDDFHFFDAHSVQLSSISTESFQVMDHFQLRYKRQKNGRCNEIIPYKRDRDNPAFCPGAAALRIRLRAQRLDNPTDEPLAVYRSAEGKYAQQRCFITSSQVATFLRAVAQKVYKIKASDKILAKWSSHSIRVTACNLLHRQGMSDSYIQTRLRWKSNSFLNYLRNTLYAASAHTKAIHIPANNLPRLTAKYDRVTLPGGGIGVINSTTAISALPRYRTHEDFEQILSAGAA
jgi:hypothetical protein